MASRRTTPGEWLLLVLLPLFWIGLLCAYLTGPARKPDPPPTFRDFDHTSREMHNRLADEQAMIREALIEAQKTETQQR